MAKLTPAMTFDQMLPVLLLQPQPLHRADALLVETRRRLFTRQGPACGRFTG